MMTTLERKKIIKEKIDFSDETTLEKIEKILKENVYQIPEELLPSLMESREQYEKGEFLTEEEAEKDFEKWLKEK